MCNEVHNTIISYRSIDLIPAIFEIFPVSRHILYYIITSICSLFSISSSLIFSITSLSSEQRLSYIKSTS